MRVALLVAGEDRLHALDRLVGGLLRRPLVDGDPRHGLAPDVLVVELGERRVLVVLEHLVLTVEEDRRRHGDVQVLLALGPWCPMRQNGSAATSLNAGNQRPFAALMYSANRFFSTTNVMNSLASLGFFESLGRMIVFTAER